MADLSGELACGKAKLELFGVPMLRFCSYPGRFDVVPGSVDRGLFSSLPRIFSPVLWLVVLGVRIVGEVLEVFELLS